MLQALHRSVIRKKIVAVPFHSYITCGSKLLNTFSFFKSLWFYIFEHWTGNIKPFCLSILVVPIFQTFTLFIYMWLYTDGFRILILGRYIQFYVTSHCIVLDCWTVDDQWALLIYCGIVTATFYSSYDWGIISYPIKL